MPTVSTTIANPDFELGNTGWTIAGGWQIIAGIAYSGSWGATINTDVTGVSETSELINENCSPVGIGTTITVKGRCYGVGRDGNVAAVLLRWLDASFNVVRTDTGNSSNWGSHGTWDLSTVTGSCPAGAVYAQVAFRGSTSKNGQIAVDSIEWTYVNNQAVVLLLPEDGSEYQAGASVPLKVQTTGTSPTPVSVVYKDGATPIGSTSTAPFDYATTTLAVGTHSITAEVTFSDTSVLTTAANDVTIVAVPTPPTLREYRASNSYAYLVAENFTGLSAAMPLTALVTAIEVVFDYNLTLLVRSKDLAIPDPAAANPNVIFDITDGAKIEAVLLEKDGTGYTASGGSIFANVPLDLQDFDTTENGTSEGMRWTVMESDPTSVTLGDDTSLFGLSPIAASIFTQHSLGFRFVPNLLPKPAYADSGDACIRLFIDKLRLRVYFDAGSAEYYFASPDKTQVIKGDLVHATVDDGNFQTSDASGTLQLAPELEVMDGTTTWIGTDWTIHAAYPPTDDNQIGVVTERGEDDTIGMRYNGLPTQKQIVDNRTRYMFITNNFYGDKDLDSMYGAHGLPRAFAYNGEEFYKIHTQPDPAKDSPRHVAYHHSHLALGFNEGRVDISVAGEPYNFSGLLGASSWAIGDKVVGLLPLSGTILGIYGSKSIWGISGTTVDNFATQIISPNIGAIEYTVTDMGFPVHANSYGIYTLAQTQQYGDYLGSPMSQDVSPWLRPRLVRKSVSDKEVVVAWPVRTKNQYRLAFKDGYVLSMTLNAGQQQASTFSLQQYEIYSEEDE
jgi:hypothetical protein